MQRWWGSSFALAAILQRCFILEPQHNPALLGRQRAGGEVGLKVQVTFRYSCSQPENKLHLYPRGSSGGFLEVPSVYLFIFLTVLQCGGQSATHCLHNHAIKHSGCLYAHFASNNISSSPKAATLINGTAVWNIAPLSSFSTACYQCFNLSGLSARC